MGRGVQNGLRRLITQDRLFVVLTSILHRIEHVEISRLMYGLTCEVMQVPSYKAQKAQKSYGQGGSGAGVKNGLGRLITHDRLFIVLTSILRWIELVEISNLIYGLTCEVMWMSSYKRQRVYGGAMGGRGRAVFFHFFVWGNRKNF
jgi:hypothetical protein